MTESPSPVPVVLTIDVEPDLGQVRRGVRDRWSGFEATFEYARRLRTRLEGKTGRAPHFNWMVRMDNQIAETYGDAAWSAEEYGRQFAELEAAADLLGVHPHAWRWRDPAGRWVQDHADADWFEEVTATSFDAYERAFGKRCRVQKFGSRYVSARLIRQVAGLGARVDLTVEPGARGMVSLDTPPDSTGHLPDQAHAPRSPYRPAADDPLRADESDHQPPETGLWMLPQTAFDPDPWLPTWRRLGRRIRFAGRPRHRPGELWAPVEPARFWRVVARSLEAARRPYLFFSIRSDALIRPALATAIQAKLDRLADSADREFPAGLWFATATEAVDALTTEK